MIQKINYGDTRQTLIMPRGVYPRADLTQRICYCCGSNTTLTHRKKGRDYLRWYLNHDKDNNVFCHLCYNKLIDHPKYARTRIWFKSQRLVLKENPRKGICSQCHSILGIDCKTTQIHHIKYHEDDPLKDTVELCPSCHATESQRLRHRGR